MAHLLEVSQASGRRNEVTALLDQVSNTLEGQQVAIPSVRSATYTVLAKAHSGMQMFGSSEVMLKRALDVVVPEYGDMHCRAVDINIRLSEIYKIQGKYEEARDLFHKLTIDIERTSPPDDPNLLLLYFQYGTVLTALKNYREVEKIFAKAYHGCQQCFGLGNRLVTISFRELANATRIECNDGFKLALKLCQETMEASNASLGPNHMLTRAAAFEAGITLSRQHKWSEAEKCFERVIQSGCDDFKLLAIENSGTE